MTERTDMDESIDEAIEVLIDEYTEGFVLVATTEDGECHLVQATDSVHQELLAVFMAVENVRRLSDEAGAEMSAYEILVAAGRVAKEVGYLREDAQWSSWKPGE